MTASGAPESGGARSERERILDAARDEFIAHGFRRSTVPEIARRAGVSRQTVYRYCGSKAEIARDVVNRDVLDFFLRAIHKLEGVASAEELLVEAFVLGVEEAKTHPLILAVQNFEPDALAELMAADSEPLEVVTAGMSQWLVLSGDIDAESAYRAAELILRLTLSLMFTPSQTFALDTEDQAREFAGRYFVPLLRAARAGS